MMIQMAETRNHEPIKVCHGFRIGLGDDDVLRRGRKPLALRLMSHEAALKEREMRMILTVGGYASKTRVWRFMLSFRMAMIPHEKNQTGTMETSRSVEAEARLFSGSEDRVISQSRAAMAMKPMKAMATFHGSGYSCCPPER